MVSVVDGECGDGEVKVMELLQMVSVVDGESGDGEVKVMELL